MDDQVKARLAALRAEFETGQKTLAELDGQRQQLMETMLRISGAIQVLDELCSAQAESDPSAGGPAGGPEPVAEAA